MNVTAVKEMQFFRVVDSEPSTSIIWLGKHCNNVDNANQGLEVSIESIQYSV